MTRGPGGGVVSKVSVGAGLRADMADEQGYSTDEGRWPGLIGCLRKRVIRVARPGAGIAPPGKLLLQARLKVGPRFTVGVRLLRKPLRIDLLTAPDGVMFEAYLPNRKIIYLDGLPVNFTAYHDLLARPKVNNPLRDLDDLINLSCMLALGTSAPDFTLPATTGQPFCLSAYRGRPVVLFFYPRDFTSGCEAEVCAFRDDYADFVDHGAIVAGISMDDEEKHQRFSAAHRLPYPLLADPAGQVRRRYDVPRLYGFLPMTARVTYVIDAAGIIRYAYNSNSAAGDHARRALEVVKGL